MPCTFISYKKPPSSGSEPLPPLAIGSGNDNLTKLPLYGLYDYSQGGMIYLAEELIEAGAKGGGSIVSISFELYGWRDYLVPNQTIKISNVATREMPRAGYPDYRGLVLSDTTPVIIDRDIVMGSSGWQKFDFDTPFNWNGTNNILISWENRDGDWDSGYGWLKGDNLGEDRSNVWYSDGRYPTRSANNMGGRPNLRINDDGSLR